MTDAELEELEALLAKATPGEWRQEGWYIRATAAECEMAQNKCGTLFVTCTGFENAWEADANTKLTVAAVNALHSLISTIRTIKAELEKRDRVVEAARVCGRNAGAWGEASTYSCHTIQTDLTELSAALSALDDNA